MNICCSIFLNTPIFQLTSNLSYIFSNHRPQTSSEKIRKKSSGNVWSATNPKTPSQKTTLKAFEIFPGSTPLFATLKQIQKTKQPPRKSHIGFVIRSSTNTKINNGLIRILFALLNFTSPLLF